MRSEVPPTAGSGRGESAAAAPSRAAGGSDSNLSGSELMALAWPAVGLLASFQAFFFLAEAVLSQ